MAPPFAPRLWLAPALSALLLAGAVRAAEPTPVVTARPDHADGVYRAGETATWTVDVPDAKDREGLNAVPYVVTRDGVGEAARGTLDLSSGPATIAASRTDPGALLAVIGPLPGAGKKPLALGGALFAPGRIGPAVPAPADFDAFWQAKLAELDRVPIDPVLERVEGLPHAEGLEYDKVTLDNIRGTHVRGQLARPAQGEKFPAMLVFQWAGLYPLAKESVLAPARAGWLTLNISAHDLPIDESDAFYADQQQNGLKDYTMIGRDDRESSYFLRMFLGCVRAAEYLASRPDWDGRVLIVTGTSQGGLQALAAAALFPQVTGLMALVPAGCDNGAPLGDPPRAAGWPYWLASYAPGRDMTGIIRASAYFDGIAFARRVKCPALIGVGLIDETSRPAGVLAAYNALGNAAKELVVLPLSDHHGHHGAQAPYAPRFDAWRDALRRGTTPPPGP